MVNEEDVISGLKQVIDPHTNQDVYEMGLIKDLGVDGGEVTLTFVPSSPYCPLGIQLAEAIRAKVRQVPGVDKVNISVKGHVSEEDINKKLKC